MKISREAVLDWMKHFPAGVTNAQTAAKFDAKTSDMATRMKQYFDKGYIKREVLRHTPTGQPVYVYKPTAGVTPEMPKAERVSKRDSGKTTVRVREDSGKTATVPTDLGEMSELVKKLADGLASQIAAQVVVSLQSRLQHELAAIIPPTVSVPSLPAVIHPPSVVQTDRNRKHKVLILGLMPTQAGMISEEFGDVFDLRFWKNESHALLRTMAHSSDTVLCMVGFMSHGDMECVKTAYDGKPTPVNGGMTALRSVLTNMHVNAG